jgi:hypothetical protein
MLESSPLLTILGQETKGRQHDTDKQILNSEILKILKSVLNLIWTPVHEENKK